MTPHERLVREHLRHTHTTCLQEVRGARMTPHRERGHERAARRRKPGTRVQSSYRVPWLGTIESVTGSIAVVTITHDREGRELLKPLRGRVTHVAWLTAINA